MASSETAIISDRATFTGDACGVQISQQRTKDSDEGNVQVGTYVSVHPVVPQDQDVFLSWFFYFVLRSHRS